MRSLTVTLCIVVALGVGLTSPAAGIQAEPTPPAVDLRELDNPVGGIIPDPNSGSAPRSASDRGGALQLGLLALIIGFGAVAVLNIRKAGRPHRGSAEVPDTDVDTPSS